MTDSTTSPVDAPPDLAFAAHLKKSIVRVPTMLQMEVAECGAASLGMMLAYFGHRVTLEELRHECGVSRDGVSARSVVTAARSFGLTAQGVSIDLDGIPVQQFPFIAYWDFAHFLVIEGVDSKGVYVNDPAR